MGGRERALLAKAKARQVIRPPSVRRPSRGGTQLRMLLGNAAAPYRLQISMGRSCHTAARSLKTSCHGALRYPILGKLTAPSQGAAGASEKDVGAGAPKRGRPCAEPHPQTKFNEELGRWIFWWGRGEFAQSLFWMVRVILAGELVHERGCKNPRNSARATKETRRSFRTRRSAAQGTLGAPSTTPIFGAGQKGAGFTASGASRECVLDVF